VSTPPPWITPDHVAAYLDLPAAAGTDDDNLALSTAAVKAAVERRRSDLWTTDTPPVFVPGDDVHAGSVRWAALMYQARNAPSGFAGYGDETALFDSLGANRAEIMRLIGWRRPVAL
jgi:hypothetical protein